LPQGNYKIAKTTPCKDRMRIAILAGRHVHQPDSGGNPLLLARSRSPDAATAAAATRFPGDY
jgi:hypothetical protein